MFDGIIEFFKIYGERMKDWLPPLLEGAVVTIQLTVVSFLLAVLVGLVLAVAQLAPSRVVRIASKGSVEVIRGVPVLVVLFLVYFGLPDVGLVLSPFVAASIGFAIYVGAYLAEVFRGGILSVHEGQREAASSVGLTPRRFFLFVVLPQAFRTVLPPFTNTLLSLTKQTSLAAIIAVREVTLAVRNIATLDFRPMHLYLLAGAIYPAMGYVLAWAGKRLERRLHYA